MVSVDVPEPLATVAGAKLQVTADGKPIQDKATEEANVSTGVIVILDDAESPGARVDGLRAGAAKRKSGVGGAHD